MMHLDRPEPPYYVVLPPYLWKRVKEKMGAEMVCGTVEGRPFLQHPGDPTVRFIKQMDIQ